MVLRNVSLAIAFLLVSASFVCAQLPANHPVNVWQVNTGTKKYWHYHTENYTGLPTQSYNYIDEVIGWKYVMDSAYIEVTWQRNRAPFTYKDLYRVNLTQKPDTAFLIHFGATNIRYYLNGFFTDSLGQYFLDESSTASGYRFFIKAHTNVGINYIKYYNANASPSGMPYYIYELTSQTTVNIPEPLAQPTYAVYPNPVTDKLHIVPPVQELTSCELYKLDGTLVQKTDALGAVEMDMSYLPAGMYLLKLTGAHTNRVQRVVKL